MEYEELKKYMLRFAADINNMVLYDAVGYSIDIYDLKNCVKQAYGVGSRRFQKTFAYVLDLPD